MSTLDIIKVLLEGFGNSLLITVLSVIFPLIIGTIIIIFSSKFKVVNSIFGWLSVPFECLCPIFLCTAIYFLIPMKIIPYDIWYLIITVFVLSLCFMGYMPARCVQSYSAIKNILYNGIGLVRNIFMWSLFVSGCTMANTDLFKATSRIISYSYNTIYWLIPLLVSIVILFIFELARRLIKQFMK